MNTPKKKLRLGARLILALADFRDALKAGRNLNDKFTVRTVRNPRPSMPSNP